MTRVDGLRPDPMTSDPAVDRLEDDLRHLYAVAVPRLTMPEPARPEAGRPMGLRGLLRRGRPVRLGLAMAGVATALAVTIVGLPALGGAGTSSVNGQELLNRTSRAGASGSLPAYHLSTVRLAGGDTMWSETWQGAAGWRTESTSAQLTFGIVDTGAGGWLYQSMAGSTVAVRVATSERGGRNLTPDSVAATLEGFTIPGCQAATITGETTFLGRAVWQVEVSPTPESCTVDNAGPGNAKVVLGVGKLRPSSLLIDKATEITLLIETHDETGAVSSRYEVTALEAGESAAATGLPYRPPTGATIREGHDFVDAKALLQP